MSSPGYIVDPRQRPQSTMSAASTLYRNPSSARQQPFKEYGQDYQFAETWSNPPPEFCLHPPPPPVAAPLPVVDEESPRTDGINESVRDLFRDDEANRGSNPKEHVWVAPPEKSWFKRIPHKWWIVGGITFGGIIAVIMAILGGMGIIGDHSSSVSPSGSNTPTGKLTPSSLPEATSSTAIPTTGISKPTGTSSSTPSQPTSTNLMKDCSNEDLYHDNVGFIGSDPPTLADITFVQVSSAHSCCDSCFRNNTCAGWYYTGGQFTPCSLITLHPHDDGKDDKCPNGRVGLSVNGGNGIAGNGPCANNIK